jgi:hypothetical protein
VEKSVELKELEISAVGAAKFDFMLRIDSRFTEA